MKTPKNIPMNNESSELSVSITDRKRSSNHDKYNLINHINDVICEIDEQGKFVFVNKKLTEVLGYEPEEILGLHFSTLVHPDEYTKINLEFGRNINSMSEIVDTYRFKHKKGHYLIMESKGTVFIDPKTNAKHIVAISRDLTEQKLSEEFQRISERKYRILHESMMDGFVYTNVEGRILEFNSTYQQMIGYHPVELLQLHYEDITPAKWHTFEKKIVDEQVMVMNYSEVYQKEYIRKNGSVFPVELRTFLIRDEHRHPIGMWSIVRDITYRKQREDQMELLTKQLQDSLETKDKLFSIIAHDLRSPFNCLVGYTELMQEDIRKKDIDAIEGYFDRFSSSVKQSYFLLENLLFWSNAQTRRISLNIKEIKLLPLIKQTIALFAPESKSKQIEILVEESCNVIIYTDLQMLKSILRNLLSNAIKYSHISGRINFKVENKKGFHELIIADRGIGMSREQFQTLFDKHVYDSTPGTCHESGSGLGLKIITEFVEHMGGRIWAVSKKNKGSSFHLTIPRWLDPNEQGNT